MSRYATATHSARAHAEVTPSDAEDLEKAPCRALYIGVGGDVEVHDSEGNAATYVGVLTGSILPVQAKRVLSTGTTATNIVALY